MVGVISAVGDRVAVGEASGEIKVVGVLVTVEVIWACCVSCVLCSLLAAAILKGWAMV